MKQSQQQLQQQTSMLTAARAWRKPTSAAVRSSKSFVRLLNMLTS